jgi:hypothetical protein
VAAVMIVVGRDARRLRPLMPRDLHAMRAVATFMSEIHKRMTRRRSGAPPLHAVQR